MSDLRPELSKPEYAGLTDAEAVAVLNAPTVARPRQCIVTTRTLMADLGLDVADRILTALEAAATQNRALNRVLILLSPAEGGVDIGHRETRKQIETLAAAGVLQRNDADALLALGIEMISPAAAIGCGVVTEADVHAVRNYA